PELPPCTHPILTIARCMSLFENRRMFKTRFFKLAVLLVTIIWLGHYYMAQTQTQSAAVEAEWKATVEAVQKIVNQPVRSFPRTEEMRVSTYRPGWFHDGAITPDFKNVDVRNTRETPYDGKEYVTSDLNPGIVFHGDDLEFNPMTKAFYLD